ncbi:MULTISPECIES: 2OG-Fe(II) oxygenase [Xanthomarina]|jgi:SM-20-related protein|uniref:2OG-Fe(II) oxygenase n=2 Tax=Xanthomarina gelatinilytica TaxID=1137281 RepID=M7MLT9_9FLAO|nr:MULTISPECIES: 2OG-Fe(II) oxygenase [Xanthomarina]EMQ95855.1 SM-20-related protein [Xanthomarina gelatinilytica]MAL22394.1 oxidoreductase [Xanthomarina sp.]MBF60935.1 oxidoreductase [Xanthomarina sp.]MDX1316595.1 2OG-Fe(II) oxygenase [Xanthomarina gelatinilytica]HCY83143.1 2OG-Fe(II) oxygenase [Xanthomarina gelatinilytica]|tara:strand:+ start:468 stop:1109 length:642 start_codon:yes stop_codon:yes gene_type:complete
MNQLFEEIAFAENPQYERIIEDLLAQQYSIVEDFFTAEDVSILRQSLVEKHEEDAFKKAAIGNRVNEIIVKSIRGDVILWMDELQANEAEMLFFNKINNLVNYLNKTCFLGILHKEFHYALYPEGTYYKRHLDTFQNDDRRKLSFVCYLNEEGWLPENGGELVLYLDENGKETEKVIYPFPGRVVIFESQIIEHEVKPVNKERMSITGWLKTR